MSKYLAPLGQRFTQAQHFIQMPVTCEQSAGFMEPIGQIEAQKPQLLHKDLSVCGFTFLISTEEPFLSVA